MAHECAPIQNHPNHDNKTLKLSGIVARLQSIMYTENLSADELVQCARIVQRSNREITAIQGAVNLEKENKTEGETFYCNFCQKDHRSVRRLFAVPGGDCICNECVELCDEIICNS